MAPQRAHAVVPPVPGAPADADETDALRCGASARTGEPIVVLGPSAAIDWARALGLAPTHCVPAPTRWHARRAIARLRRTIAERWLAWGEAAARLSGLPGVQDDAGDRDGKRFAPTGERSGRELGLAAGEVAIAPVIGRPAAIDAQRALYLLGALELMGRRVALVLPEGAARLDQARAFAAATGLATRVLVHPWPLTVAARSIDLGLIDGDAPPDGLLVRAFETAGARTVRVDRGAHARPGLVDAAHAVGPIDRAIAALRADPVAAAAHNPA